MNKKILIRELGMKPHLAGLEYIEFAIKSMRKEYKYRRKITKLYEHIGQYFGVSSSAAERNIRYAISQSKYNDMSNKEFLMWCIYNI